jgi:hypothetical protein
LMQGNYKGVEGRKLGRAGELFLGRGGERESVKPER